MDPDLVDYFYNVKDRIVSNMAADSSSCIGKFICEATLSEDPIVQHQILKW